MWCQPHFTQWADVHHLPGESSFVSRLPTGELPAVPTMNRPHSDRGLMMPMRRRTREQGRACRIDTEPALNNEHIAERNQPPPF